tara:strand:+ start:22287 stop:23723 length:1437 start_codon:yes stop_codon:yes gene_type:complete
MADRFKVQAKGGKHVVITVDSSDLSTILGTREFATRNLRAVKEAGAINLETISKGIKVFGALAHATILKSDNSVWAGNIDDVVTALNAFFLTTPHNLEELDDIPAPINDRFLKYSSDTYSWETASGSGSTLTQEEVEDYVGGMLDGDETFIAVTYDDTDGNIDFVVPVKDEDAMGSNSDTHLATQQSIKAYVDANSGSLSSAITISNADPSFAHMTTPISSGTSLEAVLRDMLEMYNVTSISLTHIKAAFQATGSNGSYGTTTYVSSLGSKEVGQGIKVDGFKFSIADTSQTGDTSVVFKIGGSSVQTGISDTGSPVTLSANTQDPGTASSVSYLVEATDSEGESNVTITASKSLSWLYRVKFGASSTATLADAAAAQTLYEGLNVTGGYDNIKSSSNLSVSGNTATNTAGNYTWIIYPVSFTTIGSILQGATEVIDAFQTDQQFSIVNQYGVTIAYYFKRSNITQAFSTTANLTIDF